MKLNQWQGKYVPKVKNLLLIISSKILGKDTFYLVPPCFQRESVSRINIAVSLYAYCL